MQWLFRSDDGHRPELPSDNGSSAYISDSLRNPSRSKPVQERTVIESSYLNILNNLILTLGWALQDRRTRPYEAKLHREQTTLVCGRWQMQSGLYRAASTKRFAKAELDGLADGRAREALFIVLARKNKAIVILL